MDNKSKFKQFLKKEGFYVILFVCLCAVATVAVITAGNRKDVATNPPVIEETAKAEGDSVVDPKNFNDALQVKKEELEPVPNVQVQKENDSKAVSKQDNSEAVNPVKGSLARAYSEDPVYMASTKDYRPHFGMDIKTEKGAPVVVAMDGVVKSVDVSTEGTYVEVDHQNGILTKYCNLEEKVNVKKGDNVKASQELGKIGNTTNFAYEEYGPHLHFEVSKDGKNVDPAKFVSYKK
ncbi:peptidase M23 family protein [Clostridium argentinense CDC 2741]|uniref:Peptidase M23 family protein n=1 Tax=Clostridium argentinense CDC 2741 TaxID=1418104 RepID=A0A0C1QXB0_9CLOT|nr:M23 family metallopeptidase [Clostridium argentinense]ARC86785.1 membrane-associated protein [Clostridium argentinense]KIE45647.1 peptidase M23 family protein [Clostridium argentinense CDC 2741]NFF38531.1 M23 family metallopeptidase [Clostridium argentinense]NFP49276.1 M23 family metallopeptidase [Clostridium argentinense]NFP71679.1 M23 family metallopeptidase [Clostridium argentinense]